MSPKQKQTRLSDKRTALPAVESARNPAVTRQRLILFALSLFALALLPRIILAWYFPQFSGDMARDAYFLRSVLEGNWILVGPHIGRIGIEDYPHLGPLSYYLILPFFWVSQFTLPQLANLPVVLFDSAAAVLMFFWLRGKMGFYPALLGYGLYALLVNNIFWGSFYWNCNYGAAFAIGIFYILEHRKHLQGKFAQRWGWLLATLLVAMLHLHLVYWLFVLPVACYLIWQNQQSLKRIVLLGAGTFFPYLIAEWQSGGANTRAFVASSGGEIGLWPFHNLGYFYQNLSALFFWNDKMHLDLNAFMPGDGLWFGVSILFVGMVVAGAFSRLRRGMSEVDRLGLLVLALLLLLPVGLNAQRYWLFLVAPFAIYYLCWFVQVSWQRPVLRGNIAVLLLLAFSYNWMTGWGMLRAVSEDRYDTAGSTMVSIGTIQARSEEIFSHARESDVLLVASPEVSQVTRSFLPLRYFGELAGKQIHGAEIGKGHAIREEFFWPRREVAAAKAIVDPAPRSIFWVHTLEDPFPNAYADLPTQPSAPVYWGRMSGRDIYVSYLGEEEREAVESP